MNLNAFVSGPISAVNPMVPIKVRVSTGSVANADTTRTPTYAPPVIVRGQVQPLSSKDIRQLEGLNIQGYQHAVYLNGQIEGLVRSTNQGGDLLTMPNGDVWLVGVVLEAWVSAGWCKVAVVLQDGS